MVDFGPIRNPTTNSSQRLRFWSKFDHFWIKIDHFWSIFYLNRSFLIYFWFKDQKRPSKCWLFNRKRRIISKMMIYIKNDDENVKVWSFSTIFNPTNFWYNSTNFWFNSNLDLKSVSEFELIRNAMSITRYVKFSLSIISLFIVFLMFFLSSQGLC